VEIPPKFVGSSGFSPYNRVMGCDDVMLKCCVGGVSPHDMLGHVEPKIK